MVLIFLCIAILGAFGESVIGLWPRTKLGVRPRYRAAQEVVAVAPIASPSARKVPANDTAAPQAEPQVLQPAAIDPIEFIDRYLAGLVAKGENADRVVAIKDDRAAA